MKRKAHTIVIHTRAGREPTFTCVDQNGEHLHVLTGDTVTWIWAGQHDFAIAADRSPFGEMACSPGLVTTEVVAEHVADRAEANCYQYIVQEAMVAACDPEIIVDPPDYDQFRKW